MTAVPVTLYITKKSYTWSKLCGNGNKWIDELDAYYNINKK